MGVLEVPAKLDLVPLHYLAEVSTGRSVSRLEQQRRETRPELYLPQITGQSAGVQPTEHIEQRRGRAGFGVCSSPGERFAPILHIGAQQPRVPLVAESCGVVEAQHEMPRVGIGSSGRQVDRFRKWKEVRHMSIDQVHLFGHVVPSQLFVEFEKAASFEDLVVLVERLFADLQEVRCIRWKVEVQLAAFANTLQGTENENAVVQNWAAYIHAGLPTQQEGCPLSRDIGGIDRTVAMKSG